MGPFTQGSSFGALDRFSRLRDLVWRSGAYQQRVQQTSYDYDRHSLISQRNEQTFQYTDLDQLKALSGPGEYQSWHTDSVGTGSGSLGRGTTG